MRKPFFIALFLIFGLQNFAFHEINSSERVSLNKNSQYKYILGAGDLLNINVYKSPEFGGRVEILSDGSINLVRLGSIYIEGLTIDQATEIIEEKYKQILRLPIVSINLVSSRPLRISVLGEVKRPGFYTIDPKSNKNRILNSDGGESISEISKGWPTLVEALQRAGGITQSSNLKEISLIRNSSSNQLTKKFNFYNSLIENKKLINPKIYDGDTIFVPKVENLKATELTKISTSNLSAPSITVSIIGEVVNPGQYNIRSDTPLNHAILFAGGFTSKSNKNLIKLVRLKSNGSIFHQEYKYDIENKRDKIKNPPLKDKDVLIVKKNSYAKFGDALNNAFTPVEPILKGVRIYSLLD